MIMIIFITMKLFFIDVWNHYSDFKWGLKFQLQDNHRNLGIRCFQYKDLSYFIHVYKNIHVFFPIKLHGNIVGRIISAKCKIVLITASNQ